jgi:dTDP-4-dehydrorhamnose 3,5-epimerase
MGKVKMMVFEETILPDVLIIKPKVFGDERGFFLETFRSDDFARSGIPGPFVQDNHSGSQQGILRGMHYQIHHGQGKLVRAVVGKIFDVAVDLRRSSPTFGRWVGVMISSENKQQVWVPIGFAHGFYVLSEWAEVAYKTTDYYAPEWERSLLWNDPALGIEWPLLDGRSPVLSDKDSRGKLLIDAELFD